MIINKLTICNIRNYVGVVEVDLSVGLQKNIILIGGLNGAGKTTFADAIRVCLYGHNVHGKILSESKYQEFLSDFCTNTKPIKEAYISMNITIDEENPPIDVDVTRRFVKTKNGFKEELTLKKGGSAVELIDENYWSYYIEKLIPPNASRYFFFDGETVKETIASENAADYLLKAVKDLSGVSELENLKRDLTEVRKNILSKTKKKSDWKSIEDLRNKIDYHTSQIQGIDLELEELSNQLSELSDTRTDLDSDMSRISGANEAKKEALQNTLKHLKAEYDEVNDVVCDFCYSRMPYAVSFKSLERTIQQAKSENRSLINSYSIDVLKSIQERKDLSKQLGLSSDKAEEVLHRLMDVIGSQDDSIENPILDISLSKVSQMESLFVSESEVIDFNAAFERREHLSGEIKKITKKIEHISDSTFLSYQEELGNVEQSIQSLKNKIEALRLERASNEERISSIAKELTVLERSVILEDVDRSAVDTIEKISATIEKRIETIVSQSRKEFVRNINQIYSVLKNNEDMVKDIQLSDDYHLIINNFDNRMLKINGLSEGEKSILMYSVVYGLLRLSELKFPMIIDSPIGKMDSIHSANLAGKLYPSISEQLVLLSHNREIVGTLHDDLRPRISKEYLITKFGDPKVSPGYFD